MSNAALRAAYDGAAGAWGDGPDRVYDVLAESLLARGPAWRGLQVLDVGAGTGTATRRLIDAGASVVPTDMAAGMLAVARARCACHPVVADAMALPLRTGAVDAVVMGFLLNHLPDPAAALTEATRVVRPGGWVLASTWSRHDDHPIRHLVEAAVADRGWEPPSWYVEVRRHSALLTDNAAALVGAARAAGLTEIDVTPVDAPVALPPGDLVEWRLGMPHTAPFVAGLTSAVREELRAELVEATAGLPAFVARTLVLVARVAAATGQPSNAAA